MNFLLRVLFCGLAMSDQHYSYGFLIRKWFAIVMVMTMMSMFSSSIVAETGDSSEEDIKNLEAKSIVLKRPGGDITTNSILNIEVTFDRKINPEPGIFLKFDYGQNASKKSFARLRPGLTKKNADKSTTLVFQYLSKPEDTGESIFFEPRPFIANSGNAHMFNPKPFVPVIADKDRKISLPENEGDAQPVVNNAKPAAQAVSLIDVKTHPLKKEVEPGDWIQVLITYDSPTTLTGNPGLLLELVHPAGEKKAEARMIKDKPVKANSYLFAYQVPDKIPAATSISVSNPLSFSDGGKITDKSGKKVDNKVRKKVQEYKVAGEQAVIVKTPPPVVDQPQEAIKAKTQSGKGTVTSGGYGAAGGRGPFIFALHFGMHRYAVWSEGDSDDNGEYEVSALRPSFGMTLGYNFLDYPGIFSFEVTTLVTYTSLSEKDTNSTIGINLNREFSDGEEQYFAAFKVYWKPDPAGFGVFVDYAQDKIHYLELQSDNSLEYKTIHYNIYGFGVEYHFDYSDTRVIGPYFEYFPERHFGANNSDIGGSGKLTLNSNYEIGVSFRPKVINTRSIGHLGFYYHFAQLSEKRDAGTLESKYNWFGVVYKVTY